MLPRRIRHDLRPPTGRCVLAVTLMAAVLALGLMSGCAEGSEPEPVITQPQTDASDGVSDESSAEATTSDAPGTLDELEVALEPVAEGFESPLLVTHAGDGSGRLFVVEQSGRIYVIRDGNRSSSPFLDISRRVTSGGERGLLGLAFSPDYESSGDFYVNYTDKNGDTVVAHFTAADPSSDSPQLRGPRPVLKIKQPYGNHNGGCLVFEPGTERLWIGMGDGGSGGDPQGNAQNDKALLGKMLALDFAKGPSPKPEIVQKGLRNPWRFSFDRETDDLWIGDVGQNAYEEIDFVPLSEADGVNWGWNLWEGNHPHPEDASPSKKGYRFPVLEYSRDSGRSVTGGFVYRGDDYPAMDGVYFYGDFESGWIGAIRAQKTNDPSAPRIASRVMLADAGITPSSFGEDERGELYVCDYRGSILRIVSK